MALNVSLGKLPWYGQVGVFAALSLLGAAVFWMYVAQPQRESLAERQAQLDAIVADNARGKAIARRLPEFRREVAALEARLVRLREVLPEEKDVADLLRRIQAMATQSNLAIRGFTPQAVATRQLHAEWPIGLQLEGTYHDLGAFLERVSKFPRIINVNGIRIKGRDSQGRESQEHGATITADCIATTFVLVEPKAPAGAPAGPQS